MSIDGYLDSATVNRLPISNAADFDRVDAVRATCDAILVGAATVRNDNPRLLVRSPARREERLARGLLPSPIKVTVTARAELTRDRLLRHWRGREAGLLREHVAGRRPQPARTSGDRRRRRTAGGHGTDQRGPLRPRRPPADGRGRRPGAHPVPHRRPGRRAAPGRRAVLRRRLTIPPLRRRRTFSWNPTDAPGWPKFARSTMWCCCATPSHPGSAPTSPTCTDTRLAQGELDVSAVSISAVCSR